MPSSCFNTLHSVHTVQVIPLRWNCGPSRGQCNPVHTDWLPDSQPWPFPNRKYSSSILIIRSIFGLMVGDVCGVWNIETWGGNMWAQKQWSLSTTTSVQWKMRQKSSCSVKTIQLHLISISVMRKC